MFPFCYKRTYTRVTKLNQQYPPMEAAHNLHLDFIRPNYPIPPECPSETGLLRPHLLLWVNATVHNHWQNNLQVFVVSCIKHPLQVIKLFPQKSLFFLKNLLCDFGGLLNLITLDLLLVPDFGSQELFVWTNIISTSGNSCKNIKLFSEHS